MDKTILLTGATGKLGQKFLKILTEKGNKIVFTSRNENNIKEIEKNNKNSFGIQVDLMQEGFENGIIDFLKKKALRPEVLVNNARNAKYNKIENNGMIKRRNFINEYILEVYVPYFLSLKLVKKFTDLRNVINIASMYGVVPPNPTLYEDFIHESSINYGVTKAALIHLTKELAVRLSEKNVRVNCISYGGVEGRVNEDFKKRYSKLCPMGRMLKKDEITGALEFLISDKSIGITGHNLIVDGGWTVW